MSNEPVARLLVSGISEEEEEEGAVLPSINGLPSSLFQLTRAAGVPWALQTSETRTFSLTDSCEGELSLSIIVGGTVVFLMTNKNLD